MLLKLLNLLFGTLIGKLPEEKKKELMGKFGDLLSEVAKSAVEGAVKGAMQK